MISASNNTSAVIPTPALPETNAASSNSVSKTPLTPNQPKKALSSKLILGIVLLLLLVVGAGAGLYLNQMSQDLRQQAATYDCQFTAPFTSCDPNPATPANECTGTVVTTACVQAYQVWRCGNKNWIPDYGNPNAACGGCPWPVEDGELCCPTGVDACETLGSHICIADPFVAECKLWNNNCPAGQKNYYQAIAWCVGAGCECELFSNYSGPGCDLCGGSPPPSTPPPSSPPPSSPPPSSPPPSSPPPSSPPPSSPPPSSPPPSSPPPSSPPPSSPPPSSPPPSSPPPSSPPPSSPPIGPMCLSITMTQLTTPSTPPVYGDTVQFTCGQVNGIGITYEFRVRTPDMQFESLAATNRTSAPYTINQYGNFAAQCRICISGQCQPWEPLFTTASPGPSDIPIPTIDPTSGRTDAETSVEVDRQDI